MKPLFSVVIPAYNCSDTIGRAVDSVLGQSCNEFTLIVVNDGSTDSTREILESIDDQRVTVIHQENKGRCVARNVGAKAATGMYVLFLDSDDEAMPNWLESLAPLAAHGPEVICCGSTWIDSVQKTQKDVIPEDHGAFYFNQVFLMRAGTYAIKRIGFLELGGFEEALDLSEHTELSMRVVKSCQFDGWTILNTTEVLVTIYDGGSSMKDLDRRIPETTEIILKTHQDLFTRVPEKRRTYLDIAATVHARYGEYSAARKYWRRCLATRWSLSRFLKIAVSFLPVFPGLIWGKVVSG